MADSDSTNLSSPDQQTQPQLREKVIKIRRVVKVTKGGRTFRFSALVVVGNGQGKVGFAVGKAREIPIAITKAITKAQKKMATVPIIKTTVPHQNEGHFGASRVLIKPARLGVGIIAGGAARAVVQLAGYQNIYTKSFGSNTAQNLIAATIQGLVTMKSYHNSPTLVTK